MSNIVKLDPASNKADFIRTFSAIDENGDAIDLTGATIVFSIEDPITEVEQIAATTANGRVTISTTVMTVNIPVATMGGITEPKEYNVGCTVLLNSVTTQLFVGTLPIYDGVVP